jgi:hypothetical protein
MDGENANMGTLPTDTIPLANALLAIQAELISGKERDEILLAIIAVMSDPGLQSRLERIGG